MKISSTSIGTILCKLYWETFMYSVCLQKVGFKVKRDIPALDMNKFIPSDLYNLLS